MPQGKKPTEILREEHTNVLQKLDALEGVISRLDEKPVISAQLKELTAFFNKDFWLHFAKEEEALFPELEKFIPRQGGPLAVMLAEHEDLRKTNTEMQRGVSDYLQDSVKPATKEIIQRYGIHFIELLRGHISKENNILFHMADNYLNEAQNSQVRQLFSEIEKSKGGNHHG